MFVLVIIPIILVMIILFITTIVIILVMVVQVIRRDPLARLTEALREHKVEKAIE